MGRGARSGGTKCKGAGMNKTPYAKSRSAPWPDGNADVNPDTPYGVIVGKDKDGNKVYTKREKPQNSD